MIHLSSLCNTLNAWSRLFVRKKNVSFNQKDITYLTKDWNVCLNCTTDNKSSFILYTINFNPTS